MQTRSHISRYTCNFLYLIPIVAFLAYFADKDVLRLQPTLCNIHKIISNMTSDCTASNAAQHQMLHSDQLMNIMHIV